MTRVEIKSGIEILDRIDYDFSETVVKNEPMLFNNSRMGAMMNGGPLTAAFINHLPPDWAQVPLVIDSRVHMLMPGWFPCIPGWHHDDVARTREDGQPNYEDPNSDRAEHIMMLVNAHLAPTLFATGKSEFEVPAIGRTVYDDWHHDVVSRVLFDELTLHEAPDKTLIRFNDRTWHRGVSATGNGWRFFIRASRYWDCHGNVIERRNQRTNEVRKQVQIYMSAENAGW